MTTFETYFQDRRTQVTLGFFLAKGFLVGQDLTRNGDVKLRITDVLWVGEHVEPRVLEVLPAAMIHFPRTFLGTVDTPVTLAEVIAAIRNGDVQGPDFRGMRYQDMRKWANRSTTDGRTKPLSEIRVNKTFRLSPAAIAALKMRSSEQGLSMTRFLEELLLAVPTEV